jgi:transcriptional regulator with XRE-family HTH domain
LRDTEQSRHFSLLQAHRLADLGELVRGVSHICVYNRIMKRPSTEIYGSGFAGQESHAYAKRYMAAGIAMKIKNLRISLGINQSELAERLNVTQASVSRWEKGSVPDARKLAQLAEMAGETVTSFISGSPAEPLSAKVLNRFWVRGAVAAGVWSVAYEWPETDWVAYSGLQYPGVQDQARYGLRVDGESMNQVYPEGTILDCLKADYAPPPKNGQRVIVERRRTDGTIEATVKEYLKDDYGREWLVPRSNRPEYQRPISANDPEEGIEETAVVAW